MLNVLVVNQETGLPGHEFYPGGTYGLGDDGKRKLWEKLRKEVYEYYRWDDVLTDRPIPLDR